MRLLPKHLECPIDNLLIDWAHKVAPFFYQTGHTANLITLEGTLISFYALKLLALGRLPEFAFWYVLGYFFDCLDGHFARRYNMTSKFGEWFEHIRDIVVAVGYFYVLLNNYEVNAAVIALFLVAGFGLLCHMGNQQRYNRSNGAFLDPLQHLTPHVSGIETTRWFGCGTFNLIMILVPFWVEIASSRSE